MDGKEDPTRQNVLDTHRTNATIRQLSQVSHGMMSSAAVKLPQIPGSDYHSKDNKFRHLDGVLTQKLNKYSSMAGGQAVVDYYKNTP